MNNILNQLKFKVAGPGDVDFVIDCIIEAEKSGTEIINTCNIFSICEKEYRIALKNILLDDIPEYDFWLSGYLIAELDGRPVSAQGAWYEGNDGLSSTSVRTTMMMEYLPREKFILDTKVSNIVRALSIPRENGTIQLEHAYTIPELRRQGIHFQTVLELMKRNIERLPEASKFQTMPFRGNYKSYNEAMKIGFTQVLEKKVDDPFVYNIFAYNCKVLLELTKDKLEESISRFKIN